jgi:hypothetical protein
MPVQRLAGTYQQWSLVNARLNNINLNMLINLQVTNKYVIYTIHIKSSYSDKLFKFRLFSGNFEAIEVLTLYQA